MCNVDSVSKIKYWLYTIKNPIAGKPVNTYVVQLCI